MKFPEQSNHFTRRVFASRRLCTAVSGALAFFLDSATKGLACVGCREPGTETLVSESSTVLAGVAFSWSVLFMLGFVFLIVGGLAAYIGVTCRRLQDGHRE